MISFFVSSFFVFIWLIDNWINRHQLWWFFFCCWWSNTQERMGQISFWHDQNQSVSFSLFQSLCQNIFWLNDSNDFDGHHYSRVQKQLKANSCRFFLFLLNYNEKMNEMDVIWKILRMIYRIDNRQKKWNFFFFCFRTQPTFIFVFLFSLSKREQEEAKQNQKNQKELTTIAAITTHIWPLSS